MILIGTYSEESEISFTRRIKKKETKEKEIEQDRGDLGVV